MRLVIVNVSTQGEPEFDRINRWHKASAKIGALPIAEFLPLISVPRCTVDTTGQVD